MKNMTAQPDQPNAIPITMDICGNDLVDRIHELARDGVFIPRMESVGNSTYRLTLCFPRGLEEKP